MFKAYKLYGIRICGIPPIANSKLRLILYWLKSIRIMINSIILYEITEKKKKCFITKKAIISK